MKAGSEEAVIVQTIADQIGGRALYMMGAKDLSATEDNGCPALRFKVMRGAKCALVVVRLDPNDTYTVRGLTRAGREVYSCEDVYAENLRETIGTCTGLATVMPRVEMVRR